MSPPDINLDKRGENRVMPKTWSMGKTPCWRQSCFPLHKDGKEKGMVQKAKIKWGDAELSEMVEGSSEVMSKSQGGTHYMSSNSSIQQTHCLFGQEQSLAGTDSSTSRAPRISLQHFTYCHMTF